MVTNHMRFASVLTVICLALLSISCTSPRHNFTGQTHPSTFATVTGQPIAGGQIVTIHRINGRSTQQLFRPRPSYVQVTPGHHSFLFADRITGPSFYSARLDFQVQPNTAYNASLVPAPAATRALTPAALDRRLRFVPPLNYEPLGQVHHLSVLLAHWGLLARDEDLNATFPVYGCAVELEESKRTFTHILTSHHLSLLPYADARRISRGVDQLMSSIVPVSLDSQSDRLFVIRNDATGRIVASIPAHRHPPPTSASSSQPIPLYHLNTPPVRINTPQHNFRNFTPPPSIRSSPPPSPPPRVITPPPRF